MNRVRGTMINVHGKSDNHVLIFLKLQFANHIHYPDYLPNCKLNTKSHSLPNYVGCVVGFLNVWTIRLWTLLLAAALCFECNLV
jgi:hypothetical protein